MIQLHPGEQIVKIVRRHWYVLAVGCLTLVAMAILPGFILVAVDLLSSQVQTYIISHWEIFAFIYGCWLLILWVLSAVVWTNFYLDVLVITTDRVVDIQQVSLFARNIAEFQMANLQDMRVDVVGILPTILHFGNLQLQTAGSTREFVIEDIPHPLEVKNIIARQHDLYLHSHPSVVQAEVIEVKPADQSAKDSNAVEL